MRLKLRFVGPGARPAAVITLADTATVDDLLREIKEKGGFDDNSKTNPAIKHGFPPKTLELVAFPAGTLLSEIPVKLNNEQLTIDLPESGDGGAGAGAVSSSSSGGGSSGGGG